MLVGLIAGEFSDKTNFGSLPKKAPLQNSRLAVLSVRCPSREGQMRGTAGYLTLPRC